MPSFGNPHDPAHPTTPVESRRALRAMLLHARAARRDTVSPDDGGHAALPTRAMAAG
ncbi:5-formyltetrahydrofolate cyclo-ligase, partial [Ralstonia pseudosolanacearum]